MLHAGVRSLATPKAPVLKPAVLGYSRRQLVTLVPHCFDLRSVLFVRELFGVCRHDCWRQQDSNKSEKDEEIVHHVVCLSRLKN